MRDSINVGDKVVTIGGLCATVAKVEEERVVLEVGPNRTKMPFEKWAIKVVTIGGLCATVAKVEEERVVLEVGPNRTKMPFEKWAIGTVTEKKEVKHEIADPAKEKEEN